MDFISNHTVTVIDIIIVELEVSKLCIYIHYERNIGKNFSKLGWNCKILIDPTKVIFGYENPYIFFQCTFSNSRSHENTNINSLVPLRLL